MPPHTAMVLILLLAAFLRFHDLDAQSFWYDEGNSARIVERTPRLIVEAAAGDIHPPGYYLALAGWRLAAGFSEFSLRAFSVFWGLLTVALTYALGRRLLSRWAGVAGAFIVAVHAFQVYYSQEARMYAMLAVVGAASMYAFVRWLDTPSPLNPLPHKVGRGLPDATGPSSPLVGFQSSYAGEGPGVRGSGWAAAWALLNAAGLYTQYAYPVVMLVQGIGLAIWWISHSFREAHRARVITRYIGFNLITLLLYLPWLPTAVRQITTWPTTGTDTQFGEALGEVAALLVYGGAPRAGGVAALGVLVPLLVAGLFVWPRHGRAWYAMLLLWALLPPLGMFALRLYRPAFLKALLVGHAPLALLMAWGLTGRAGSALRPLQWMLAAGVCIGLVVGLADINDPANARADYRAIAQYVGANAQPGDAVLLDAANQWEVFTYYHREDDPDNARVYPIPRDRPVDAGATRAELDGILARHSRLFVLYWGDAESDPDRVVEGYLSAHAFDMGSTWYKDVRLVTYAILPAVDDEPAVELDARFGDEMRLAGYTLHAPQPLEPEHTLLLTLFWESETKPEGRYKVFVHLLDEAGDIVAQHDAEPGGGLRPTDTWAAGDRVTDNHGLLVPADIAPGVYQIIVGVYRIEDAAARLPLTLNGDPAGDSLPLATVEVE